MSGVGSSPSAVIDGASEDIFYASNGRLYEESFSGGSWHGPAALPNVSGVGSSPSAVIDGASEDIFYASNGRLYEESFSGGSWHGPAALRT